MVIITDSQGNPVEIAGSLTVNNVVEGGGSGGTATIDPSVLNGFLPITAGSSKPLTGSLYANEGVYLNTDATANNLKGISFGSSGYTKISASDTNLGIYSADGIYIRPGMSTDDSAGVLMSRTYLVPTTNKSMSLGTSGYNFNNIYGTTIYQSGKQVANKEDVDAKSTII
jgi:hypothetical protein